jgi:hypothetical protein
MDRVEGTNSFRLCFFFLLLMNVKHEILKNLEQQTLPPRIRIFIALSLDITTENSFFPCCYFKPFYDVYSFMNTSQPAIYTGIHVDLSHCICCFFPQRSQMNVSSLSGAFFKGLLCV